MSGRTSRSQDGDVDNMMNEILEALELIKAKMPNGEIKVIQEKISGIESSQEDMHEDLRLIKKQLLDPEDGIVVRVNKNTEFRKKKEEAERDDSKIIDEHKKSYFSVYHALIKKQSLGPLGLKAEGGN